MIIVMKPGSQEEQVTHVADFVKNAGLTPHLMSGIEHNVFGVIGKIAPDFEQQVERLEGVDFVQRISKPYKLASREGREGTSQISVGGVIFGGSQVPVIAGPCSVEGEEQIIETAKAVKAAGATLLRGGAFKPRTGPYAFQGLEKIGLEMLAKAREVTGLPIVTEVKSPAAVELVSEYADMLQVGTRNMQNYDLLIAVGKSKKPVLLKRGMSATYEEWLLAAEYILANGNHNVILCERGIRSFEQFTRNVFDIAAIPVAKKLSHLPVVADPSHATGKWYLVESMSYAAVAAGADGLIIEVHPNPDQAWSDGAQSLTPDNFAKLMKNLARFAEAAGRTV